MNQPEYCTECAKCDRQDARNRRVVFAMRRLLASLVVTPAIAVAYFSLYAVLVALGAQPIIAPTEVFTIGLFLGALVSVAFSFLALIPKHRR